MAHFLRFYRSALRNDQAANYARAQGLRRIAFMNPRGGFCLLPTSRAFREGLLRRLAAVAKTGSLRKLMSMTASHGLAIALGTLCIRVLALNGRSWTLRCLRMIARSSPIKGIPPRARTFLLGNVTKMGKYSPRAILDCFRSSETDGSTSRLDDSLASAFHPKTACSHPIRPTVPSQSGTVK